MRVPRILAPYHYALAAAIGHHPSLYFFLMRFRPRGRAMGLREDSEIVIDGFPRSGNTFAVTAFRGAQPTPVRVAHHLHTPAHIIRSVEKGIPTMMVIRAPRAAIASELVRRPYLRPRQVLREYVRFHELVYPHRSKIVVAAFEDVTTDLGVVIDRVNVRFGTSFRRFDHTDGNVAAVFALIDAVELNDQRNTGGLVRMTHVARPVVERAALQADARRRLESPSLYALFTKAERLHRSLLESG